MPAASISETAVGLVFRDQFNRSNNDTVGNNWTEPLLAEDANAVRILSNQLQMDDNVVGIVRANETTPTNGMIQLNITPSPADAFVKLAFFDDIQTSTEDGYGVTLDKNAGALLVQEVIADSGNTRATTALTPPAIVGLRGVWEVSGSDLIITARVTALLSNLQDLTEDFDDTTVAWTDVPQLLTQSNADVYIFSNSGALAVDEFILMGRNVVMNNLPSGFKVSVDGGTTKTTESSGTATIDVDAIALPTATVEVYNGSDVLQATLTQDIWGGGVFSFSAFTADIPTLLHGGIQGAGRDF